MAKPRPKMAQFIIDYFLANPEASLSPEQGAKKFGGTPHSFSQAVYRARKMGTPIRCERVYRLRSRT